MAPLRTTHYPAEWSELAELAVPELFELVSARDVAGRVLQLARNRWDKEGWLALVREHREAAQRLRIEIETQSTRESSPLPHRSGEDVLAFFFYQVCSGKGVFLDLGRHRFHWDNSGDMRFVPPRLWVVWPPEFSRALQRIYAGFYGGRRDSAYRDALNALGIAPAETAFHRNFSRSGGEPQRFVGGEFRRAMHEALRLCYKARSPIHPDFATLGILLATVYDHLEREGARYDVALAYARAESLLNPRQLAVPDTPDPPKQASNG